MPTDPPRLTAFARERRSPARFDAVHTLGAAEVELLLDAARRAPSAGNSQPWAFAVGLRGDAVHRTLVARLAPSSARWAPGAAVLIACLARVEVEGGGLVFSEFSHYDLGQAVAHLSVQAHALGLGVHQMRAFDREGLAADLGVPPEWEVTTLAAVGRDADRSGPPEGAPDRRSVADVSWRVPRISRA